MRGRPLRELEAAAGVDLPVIVARLGLTGAHAEREAPVPVRPYAGEVGDLDADRARRAVDAVEHLHIPVRAPRATTDAEHAALRSLARLDGHAEALAVRRLAGLDGGRRAAGEPQRRQAGRGEDPSDATPTL
jgi:hypothetical protein